jgi:hypothetical protein
MENKKEITAIFYKVSELSTVLVEIRQEENNFFISDKDKPIAYTNLEIAKKAALKLGANVGFLALDPTYAEMDVVNDYDGKAKDHPHELMPISLK